MPLDTGGLDLSATQWETHPAKIQEMMDLGLRWQRLRRETLADAARGLAALADASDALADGLGMDRVQDAAAVGDLLSGAALAVAAPDTSGLDLSAIQWETHAASIRDLVNLGTALAANASTNDKRSFPEPGNAGGALRHPGRCSMPRPSGGRRRRR